ncbi:hypothetical protein V1478_013464, partial [Vespula squamosa]
MRGPPSGPRGVLRERLPSARAPAAVVSQDRDGEQKRVGDDRSYCVSALHFIRRIVTHAKESRAWEVEEEEEEEEEEWRRS